MDSVGVDGTPLTVILRGRMMVRTLTRWFAEDTSVLLGRSFLFVKKLAFIKDG